jgi:hypothetical protein
MSSSTFRTVVAIVIFVHAIGHIQGLVPAFGLFSTDSWHVQSWLLTDRIGESATRIVAIAIFAICFLGFLGSGLAFLNILLPHAWWRPLAIVFAVPSLLGVILFWNGFAMFFNKIGAIAVDGVILIGMLALKWPSEAQLGL